MLRPKRSGRKDATVYLEPYWFDESQSLVELHGMTVGEIREELASPVGSLSIAQIDLLLREGIDAHYLAPIAIARLLGDLGPAERLLVRTLIDLGDFWKTHPYLRAQLEQILQAQLSRSSAGSGALMIDDELRERTSQFLQIT